MQAGAGVELHAKPGDAVREGDLLLTLHTDDPGALRAGPGGARRGGHDRTRGHRRRAHAHRHRPDRLMAATGGRAPDHRRPRPEGAAPRPPRRRAAAGNGRRAGRGVRLRRPSRDRCRRSSAAGSGTPPTRARWSATSRRSRTPSPCMQTPEQLARVARECALDLAADGVVYAESAFRARAAHRAAGLSLEEVVEAVLAGFREGEEEARAAGIPIRMRHAAHRHAPRGAQPGDRRARRALPRRRRRRLRHRRRRGGLPSHPPPRRLRVPPP